MKGRVIAQYDLNGNKLTTFSGYKEIYEKHNYNKPPIFCCCKGERKSAYGFVWKYENIN